jgi:glycosyltransferase involved in cell wall biosynthesis
MVSIAPTSPDNSEHYDECVDVIRSPGALGYFSRVLPIRKHVKRMKPQVVHGHYMTSGGFFSRWSGHRPVVTSVWGSDIYLDPKRLGQRMLVKSAIRGSDVVTGDSDHILQTVKLYDSSVRTHKFLFGVDTDLFVPKPELKPKVFTFLSGRSSYPIYNPILIVEAFELLDGADSRLLIQRSKKPYPELENAVAQSSARDRIEWYPVGKHSEMPNLFNRAHVTISIPDSDSSSAVMMESMSCGVPVIASNIPANDEWDGFGVFMLKNDSPEALADLMKKLMGQPQLMDAYGRAARDVIIQRADWDMQMQGLVKLYEELVG